MEQPSVFKVNAKPVYTIGYYEFECFVAEKYSIDNFSIYEMNNDSTISCNINPMFFSSSDEEEARELIYSGNCPEWKVSMIVNLLYKDGHILDGEYLIDVCW